MAFNFKKRFTMTIVLVMALFTFIQSAAFGAEEPGTTKVKPFPSQSSPLSMFSISSLYGGNIGNDFVQAQVGSDGRFNAGLKDLSSTNWYNIIYAWSSSPWSSFTTLKVDGTDLIYGNYPDGTFIQSPRNNEDSTMNDSVWKTGDITVKQVLQAGINPATGQPDALQIKYIITNTGTQNHEVGLRMMLDTMVNGNDSAPFKIPGSNGVESINYEKEYSGDNVPSFWQVFNNFDYPDISAQYSMRGRGVSVPDRFVIANWGSISGTKWDYQIHSGWGTGDSAVGMWWNPMELAPGAQKIITTYYGRPGVGGDQALVLSSRKKLTYDEWSTSSFNLISYFTNNTSSTQNDVRLVFEADPGIKLVDNDPEHVLGTINSGNTTQSSWRLQATFAGKHNITVKAYSDDSNEPFATTQFEVEALEPVVPPNISLGGSNGTSADGTPIAGRVSPLTINASFDNPKASSVTLIAVDNDGTTYQHDMDSTNSVNWTHSFTPSRVGLWDTPMTIRIIPHYPDGSTGAEQEFPVVLIDPSGFIYNANKGEDWKLPGSTVVLQYFDPEINTWVNMSEEGYPGRMSPITNPQITGSDGRYAWDVAAGRYRVVVSRQGFETITSREVVIPPAVNDLYIGLVPTDDVKPTITATGISDNGVYTVPVNINFTSSDNESGIRSIAYKVDGNNEVQTNGNSVTVPQISNIGTHTISVTAVDYAGNETVKTINFQIKNLEQDESMLTVTTAASDKSKSTQTYIQAALNKINSNSSRTLINNDLNNALAKNAEAKVKVTRLKELLNAYNSPQIPAKQLQILRNDVLIAEQQNILATTKLGEAVAAESLSTVKTKTSEALKANAYSLNYLEYIKANLKAYGIK